MTFTVFKSFLKVASFQKKRKEKKTTSNSALQDISIVVESKKNSFFLICLKTKDRQANESDT